MDLTTYENLIKSESTARKYVLEFCWKNQQRFCPKCRFRKFYIMADSRRRCHRCRYTFHDFSGRWINIGNLACGQWLRIIKLFELELPTRKIAIQMGLAYNIVYKAITTICLAIMAHAEDAKALLGGEVEMNEAYFGDRRKGNRGRGAYGKVPVFGILERKGRVFVQVIPNVRAETVLDLTVKKVKRGSIVYTNKFKSYDALMFCGYSHLQIDHGKNVQVRFGDGNLFILT